MADLLDTPSRLLRRVQQYEDMELPSLPSFQHHVDDSTSIDEGDSSDGSRGSPMAVVRQPDTPARHVQYDVDDSLDASLDASHDRSVTEAVASEQTDDTRSTLKPELARSTAQPVMHDWGSSLTGEHTENPHESIASYMSETPLTRRMSSSNVLLDRPKRLASALPPLPEAMDEPAPRIPSLSRSEVSASDSSGAATTPEGPMRVLQVQTPSLHASPDETQTSFVHVADRSSRALRDVTSSFQDAGTPLNDGERRKSHILAVLGSSSRAPRPRGTPHPLRRVSLPVVSGPDASFVSVASSADLTSDRRGAPRRLANTSFPAILDAGTPGSVPGDYRVDGAKIHKHLNAMNKQLLETNAELAREAETWRDECDRLAQRLRDAGLDSLELPPDRTRSDAGEPSPLQAAQEARIVELERQLAHAEQQVADAETERESLQADFAVKTDEHAKRFGEICAAFEEQVRGLEAELAEQTDKVGHDSVRALEAKLAEVDTQAMEAAEQLQSLEELINEAEQARDEAEQARGEAQRARDEAVEEAASLRKELDEVASQLEAAQDECRDEQAAHAATRQELADARAELATTKASQDNARAAAHRLAPNASRADGESAGDSVFSVMEERLEEAYREIGRLKHELCATPGRRAALDARDERIRALEREKEVLATRLAAPTPFVHRTIAAIKTPKTPGPIKEYSFLQTTIGDANEPLLRAEIEHLQQQLERANAQLDHNFSRLEQAGLGAVDIAQKLAVAEDRIAQLEDELRALAHKHKESLVAVSAHKRDRREAHLVEAQMRTLRADMADEKKRLKQEVAEAQATAGELRAAMQGVTRDADHLRVAMLEKDTQLDRLARDKRDAERKLRAVQAQLDDAQTATNKQKATSQTIADLRATVRQHEDERIATHTRIDTLLAEREVVMNELSAFGRDLAQQRVESLQLGDELRALKREQTSSGDARERLTRTAAQLAAVQQEYDVLEAWKRAHTCIDDDALAQQRARAKTQSRELAAQIRYLKAKFTREASMRNALCLQKRFFLLVTGGMSLNEQATLKAIASMGFPVPAPPRPKRTLKAVATAVLGLIRARRSAAAWRDEREAHAETLALFDRRRAART